MTGNLDEAIRSLLISALPGLFDGAAPAVQLAVQAGEFILDPNSAESLASEPRPDDRSDSFAFDPQNPPANFTLSQSPYPGPKRVYLTTPASERIALQSAEVIWDEDDSQVFTLSLRPTRDLTGVNGVFVLYGVVAVFTKLKAQQALTIQLQSNDPVKLEQAEALALGVIELNRQALLDQSPASYASGDYTAEVSVKSLKLLQGGPGTANQRLLTYTAEVEVKATRALRADEGKPIRRILTPGRPPDPDRPVDIHIDVEA